MVKEIKIFCDNCKIEMKEEKIFVLGIHNDFCSEKCAKEYLQKKPALKKILIINIPENKLIWKKN